MLALLHSLAACALALLQGLTVPANDGWVTDRAQILKPEQERALEQLCESYRTGSGHEIALLTLPDLGGQPIERVALETAREWKIGREGVDDGALLVVAVAERKLRIEVGRGLEGKLTDSISGRIIRDEITPRFRSGDYYSGVRAGLEAMHGVLGGTYAPPQRSRGAQRGSETVGALMGVLFMFAALAVFVAVASRRGRGGRGSWVGPVLWGGYGGVPRSRGGFGGGLGGGGGFGGGFGGFGGGGGFSGGGASGGW